MSTKPVTKKFGKSTREVPAAADKAKKWYNADDESDPKQVSFSLDAGDMTASPHGKEQNVCFGSTHLAYDHGLATPLCIGDDTRVRLAPFPRDDLAATDVWTDM